NNMAYVSQWARPSDAVTLVMAETAVSRQQAQVDICRAVADRAIKILCKLKRHATQPMISKSILEGDCFEIPTTIKPEEVDWEHSRPVRPWIIPRGKYYPAGPWQLD